LKTTIRIECKSKKIFDQFMGRGKMPSAYMGTYLTQLHKDIMKVKKKDETVNYFTQDLGEKGILITITGSDDTIKEIYKRNTKDLKRAKNRVVLKAMRTKMKTELIK